jgi:hypothetical protein
LVMVKVPEPVHPELPVKVQLPVIVFPFTLPERTSVFPVGVPDCTVIPYLPVTFPLKSPAKVNAPVSVWPDAKHGELVVNWKLVIFSDPSLLTVIEVPKANTGELPPLTRLAFQFPLMLLAFELLFEPHPISAKPITNTITIANCFIRIPRGLKSEGRLV